MINTDFKQWLPHRAPMLMLSRLLFQDGQRVHCSSLIDSKNPLLSNGHFPAIGGLELLAQASGILLGVQATSNATRPGAIVQIKSFRLEPQPRSIPVGSELFIHARYQSGTDEAAFFEGEVVYSEQCIFSAVLMIAILPEVDS